MDPSSHQYCIFRAFSKQIPEEIKVCSPEVHVAGTYFLLCSLLLESWNATPHCLSSQDCPQLSQQIHNKFFLVYKNQVQQNTFLCWFLKYLYQEVIINML